MTRAVTVALASRCGLLPRTTGGLRDPQDRDLEHQFGAPAHADSLRASCSRAGPDILCLQETKCRDAEFPDRGLPRARLRAYRDQRPEGLSRRRHRLAPALRSDRQARLLRQGRCAPHRRDSSSAGAGGRDITVHNFYVPAGGDEPDPEVNPKFAHKLAFLDEMTRLDRRARDRRRRGDAGRRPQHRAARDGRLEPQGAAEGRQPHAGRGRAAGACCSRRAAGSTPCAASCRRGEALHLVELSLAGLGSRQQGPAPRPCLAQRRRWRPSPARHARSCKEARGWERPSDHVPGDGRPRR